MQPFLQYKSGFTQRKQKKGNQEIIQKNQKIQEDYVYKYYDKQVQINGIFDLRFKSIKQSLINQNAFYQSFFAASFQIKKFFKHFRSTKYSKLKTFPQKQFKSDKGQIRAYWLGHASVLLSIDSDTRIIIDPMFDKRLVPYVGQARHLQPPCSVQELPKIDCVLISHDHFDHCNTNSLQSIYDNKLNKDIFFLIGKNSSDVLPKGIKQQQFRQLSWTHSHQLNKNNKVIKITFVPACHWSKRSLKEQNNRLWGGFVIEALGKKIYFAGDTGKCQLFPQLYRQFGGFDLSFLPIGAYEPNQQLKYQHVNPKQAVQIHNQVKSKLSVGIHWGTFPMSHEQPHQVLKDLQQAIKQIEQGKFITIDIGKSVSIKDQQQNRKIENKEQNIYIEYPNIIEQKIINHNDKII